MYSSSAWMNSKITFCRLTSRFSVVRRKSASSFQKDVQSVAFPDVGDGRAAVGGNDGFLTRVREHRWE